MADLEAEGYVATFVPPAECAQRTNINVERVRQLNNQNVLRARHGWGDVLVRRAIVPGWAGREPQWPSASASITRVSHLPQ